MTYGTFATTPAQTWPMKEPDATLDYSYDGSADVGTDTLTGVAVSIAPSGTGELAASSVSRAGSVVTIWLAGGVAGRSYVVKIAGTCASGRLFEWPVGIAVDPVFASYPLTAPPSAGFGTATNG